MSRVMIQYGINKMDDSSLRAQKLSQSVPDMSSAILHQWHNLEP